MKRFKKVAVALTFAAAVAMMAGCSGKSDSKDETEATTEAVELKGDFRDHMTMNYNGVDFRLGDNINDLLDKLGDQSKPSETAQNCISAQGATTYYYNGLSIEASESGQIYSVTITDAGDASAKVDGSITIGSTPDEVRTQIGAGNTASDDLSDFYLADNITFEIDYQDGKVYNIWLYDHDPVDASYSTEAQ